MDVPEKSTYLIFGRGRDINTLRLGNLVTFPRNPDDDEPFICPYSTSDLRDWTGECQTDEDMLIQLQESNDVKASFHLSNFGASDAHHTRDSDLYIKASRGRRFQVDKPTEFLNEVILKYEPATAWLKSRLTITRYLYYLNRLKVGKWGRPQIWMITGIQLLSGVTVGSHRSRVTRAGANASIPLPEPVSAVANFVLADGGIVSAGVAISSNNQFGVDHHHTDERVWAAQFRLLNLDFIKEGISQTFDDGIVSLYKQIDLGNQGMKGGNTTENDDLSCVKGVGKDNANVAEVQATEKYRNLRSRLKKSANTRKHALLIGGSERNLRGVRYDLEAMADHLVTRGFSVSFCFGEFATRAGILRSWSQLLSEISEGDAVVVYYSGHGGIRRLKTPEGACDVQYIVPTDITSTTLHDFRGILDFELSFLVTLLTDITHNVTIVLDCCHSERAARVEDEEEGVRSWSPASETYIKAHMDRLKESGFLNKRTHSEGNRFSIRIAAAGIDQSAFEDPLDILSTNNEPIVMGNLTRELIAELNNIADSTVSWDMVLMQLRLKLKRSKRSQRPQIEGPTARSIFALNILPYFGQLAVHIDEEGVSLMGGSLAGIEEHDQYSIMPPLTLLDNPSKRIAVATVTSTSPISSKVTLEYSDEHSRVEKAAVAVPIRRYRETYGVRLNLQTPSISRDLHSQLASARFVHEDERQVSQQDSPAFATIEERDERLVLLHEHANPHFEYPTSGKEGHLNVIQNVIHQVEKLAWAKQVQTMKPREQEVLKVEVDIEFGLLNEDDKPISFKPDEIPEIKENQPVYLKIYNRGSARIFASVFLITSMGTINWLSHGSPSGYELQAGGLYMPGQDAYPNFNPGEIPAFEFEWPELVPRRGALMESFVVILTSDKVELGFLQTELLSEEQRPLPGRELRGMQIRSRNRDFIKFQVININYKLV